MSTDFDTRADDTIQHLKQHMGRPITYDGTPVVALDVIYGGSVGGAVHADTAVVEVACTDVPAPVYQHTVVIDGVSWRVHRDRGRGLAISGDGYTWKIPLIRDERPPR